MSRPKGGWDFGGAAGLLCAALATQLGMPLSASILLSLAGVAASAILMRRYYAAASAGALAEA